MTARSLFEKVWDDHQVVAETADTPAVLYIDLHLIHEVTTPEAFNVLKSRGLPVRRPDLTLATLDHSTPTLPIRSLADLDALVGAPAAKQIRVMLDNCREAGIRMLDFDSGQRGIVHVIGPELGITQPGKTIVCGDSHTSTHGAFGALAFGIGTTEVGHVLAASSRSWQHLQEWPHLVRREDTLGHVRIGRCPGAGVGQAGEFGNDDGARESGLARIGGIDGRARAGDRDAPGGRQLAYAGQVGFADPPAQRQRARRVDSSERVEHVRPSSARPAIRRTHRASTATGPGQAPSAG